MGMSGTANPAYIHGYAPKRGRNHLYWIWAAMVDRCRNPHSKAYKNYGGRGIHVCERWQRFEHFLADMGERPEGMSLDRINNDSGYSPDNCAWRSRKEQNRNRRNAILINGEPLKDVARRIGVSYRALHKRLFARGWSIERALTEGAK